MTEAQHIHDDDPRIQMGLPLPHGKLAMWLFLVTEIMFFTALIGTYMLIRNGTPPITRTVKDEAGNEKKVKDEWPTPHDVHLIEAIGAGNTFVLIVSSFTVVLAHYYVRKDPRKATIFVGITLALGCVFLIVKAFEYRSKFAHDILPGHMGEALPGMDGPTERKYHNSSMHYVNRIKEQLKHITSGYTAEKEKLNAAQNAEVAEKQKALAALKKQLADEKNEATKQQLAEAVKKATAAFEGEEKTIKEKYALRAKTLLDDQTPSVKKCVLLQQDMTEIVDGNTPSYTRPLTPGEVGERVNKILKDHPGVHLTPTVPHGNMWASCYFVMTGFHALHVLGGLVIFVCILIVGLKGKLGAQHENLLELTGLYWHFVDIVWIFLFPLLYLV